MLFLLLALAVLVMASPACPRKNLACGTTSISKEALDTIYYVMEWEKTLNKTLPHGTIDGAVDDEAPFLWGLLLPRPQIPVFIHVVDNYEDLFVVSQNMIFDQFQVLKSFYEPYGIDFHLLAIHYYNQPEWASGHYNWEMKAQLRLGGYDTLNIYLMRQVISFDDQVIGGFSSNPTEFALSQDDAWWNTEVFLPDGIELSVDALPYYVFGTNQLCQEGKVLVHEVGHWLGLLHIFYNGCDPDLQFGGDHVYDTPPAAYALGQCYPTGARIRTCPGPRFRFRDNLISNVLDDLPDACRSSFTDGQVDRMFSVFHALRKALPPPNARFQPIKVVPTVPTVAPNLPILPPPQGPLRRF